MQEKSYCVVEFRFGTIATVTADELTLEEAEEVVNTMPKSEHHEVYDMTHSDVVEFLHSLE